MLTYIKQKIKGWVAWVIVIIIVIPFALFGIGEYLNGPSDEVIANVDGVEILKSEYSNLYEQKKSRYKAQIGDNYNERIDKLIKENVIQELVRNEIMANYSNDQGIAVTDKELTQSIVVLEDFQDESGEFSLDRYRKVLRLSGMSEPIFERRQRAALIKNQFIANSIETAVIANNREKFILDLLNQSRKFSYLTLDSSYFLDKVAAKEEDIRTAYDENLDKFIQPRMAKVSYLVLSASSVLDEIVISDEEIRTIYEEEKDSLTGSDERRAKHILIEDEKLANEVLEKAKAGQDFEKLAKQYSVDTGSKDQGGDLGFFEKGIMVPEFEEVAFGLKKGEMSELVQSEFGYHIIVLTDIKTAKVQTFEEARPLLEAQYKEAKISEKLFKLSEEFANAAYGEVALAKVGEQFGLAVQETKFFSEQDIDKEPILSAKFIQTAFSSEVYEKSENSNVLEVGEDKFMVLRLLGKKAQRQKEFVEVKAEIAENIKQQLAQNNALIAIEKIRLVIAENKSIEANAMMKQFGLKWSDSVWLSRNKPVENIPAQLQQLIFTIRPLKSGEKSFLSTQRLTTGAALINLVAMRVDADKGGDIKKQLIDSNNQVLSNGILKTIIDTKQYSIIQDRL